MNNRLSQVGWANGFIVNPTFSHEGVELLKDATQRDYQLKTAPTSCIQISKEISIDFYQKPN